MTVVFRMALAFASLAAATSGTAPVPNSGAIALTARAAPPASSPSVPWYMVDDSAGQAPAAPIDPQATPWYMRDTSGGQAPTTPPLPAWLIEDKRPAQSRSPLFRLELDASTGHVRKVQQAPPWAMAKGVSHSLVGGGSAPGAPDTWSIILPPDPEGLSGWILKATPQEFAVVFLVIGGSIILAGWAIWAWRRVRRGELTTHKRLLLLLVRLNYRRAVLFLWLGLIAGTTLWAPFKLLDGRGHALGPAPRQPLLFAKNETDFMGHDTNIVALDFQRLFAEWVGISAAGGALLVLVRARR